MYQAFSGTNRAVVRARDESSLLQSICDICVVTGHALVACAVIRDEDDVRILGAAGPEALLNEAPVVMKAAALTPGAPTHRAINEGKTTIVSDPAGDESTPQWREFGAQIGVRELAAFPILRGGVPVGSLTVASSEGDYFDRDMVLILTEIAGQASFALDNLDRERARVEAARQAQQSNERFMVALETLPIPAMIFALDQGGGSAPVLAVNATFCELFGVAKEQLLGKSLPACGIVLPASSRDDLYLPVFAGQAVRNHEIRIWRPDGRGVTLLVSAQPMEFQGRRSALATAIDVSDLFEREHRLAGILDATLDPVITIDRQQNIVLYNEAATRTFGYACEQMMGQNLHRLTPPEYLARAERDIAAFIEDERRDHVRDFGARYRCVRADGSRVAVGLSMAKSNLGPQILVTLVFRDLTAQDLAEQLDRARRLAEMANAAKTAFLSRMSHEFRTPLNAILGFAQLLEMSPDTQANPKQLRYTQKVQKAGWHLLALTNDVLDLAKIEAGVIDLDWAPLNTRALLEDVLDLVDGQASLVRVKLVRTFETQPDHVIEADLLRLRQILLNLVSNAIKYNRHGGLVAVTSEAADGRVTIAVQDTGIGMTPDQLTQLFRPFNRLGRNRSGVEGTGIGLTIAKQLVELMGGEISITSVEGVGTTASVTLLLGRRERAPT